MPKASATLRGIVVLTDFIDALLALVTWLLYPIILSHFIDV